MMKLPLCAATATRADNLAYLQRMSREQCAGPAYFDPWHRWGSYGRWVRSKAKYQKHDRATIRKWPCNA